MPTSKGGYLVSGVELSVSPSFDRVQDAALLKRLQALDDRTETGDGFICVKLDNLKEAVRTVKLRAKTADALKKDIAWAAKRKTSYLLYAA